MPSDPNPAGNPLEHESLPASLTAYAGDYSNGNEQFKVSLNSSENTVSVIRISNGIQNIVLSLFYHDGYLYDQALNRYYFTSIEKQDYLVTFSKEFSCDNILVERLAKIENPIHLRIQINGQQWLRRNIKPYEGLLLDSSNIITILEC